MLGRTATLRTGAKIPLVGLGTWQSEPEKVTTAVKVALKAGYRHIDAAWIYGNEDEVGRGIKESGVPRDQIFLTTKLWNTFHDPKLVSQTLDDSLSKLGVDFVDLYLIHWPFHFKAGGAKTPKDPAGNVEIDNSINILDTWKAMEKLVESGKAKAIGISNFNPRRIQEILDSKPKILPAVLQVELHPYNPQPELLDFCKKNDIHVTAYSPLGSSNSPLGKEPVIQEIAKKHNKTEAQVLISWAAQRGTSVIPKSVTPERVESNFHDFILPQEDFDKINEIGKRVHKRYCDPAEFWKLDAFEEKK